MSRTRNYVFTFNNYTEADLVVLRGLCSHDDDSCTYVGFQPERGAAGTPHLQGLVIWKNAITVQACAKRLNGGRRAGGGAHVEPMRGSAAQAKTYSSKEDTRDEGAGFGFAEWGTLPAGAGAGQGHRTDFEELYDALKAGGTIEDACDTNPGLFIRHHGGIVAAQCLLRRPRTEPTKVFWFYGPTGTGKSRAAFEAYPGAYMKMGGNKWWDGYQQEECVIIDDYRRDLCTFSFLLQLFDRYPLRVEYKGGSMQFNSKVIIVTSPKNPRDTWEGRSEEDIGQLTRRIHEVRHFSGLVGGIVIV